MDGDWIFMWEDKSYSLVLAAAARRRWPQRRPSSTYRASVRRLIVTIFFFLQCLRRSPWHRWEPNDKIRVAVYFRTSPFLVAMKWCSSSSSSSRTLFSVDAESKGLSAASTTLAAGIVDVAVCSSSWSPSRRRWRSRRESMRFMLGLDGALQRKWTGHEM